MRSERPRAGADGLVGGRLPSARRADIVLRGDKLGLRVLAKPRSAKSEVIGMQEGTLLVRIAAAPVDGEANAELVRTLARHFGVPRAAVRIVSGETGRSKLIEIYGLSEAELRAKL
jgi:uncharacterized protein (TIGR00251 family)